jgi:hypothetical protein
VPLLEMQRLGLSSRCGDSALESTCKQRWQHLRVRGGDEEVGEPLTWLNASVLAPGRPCGAVDRGRVSYETRTYDSAVSQEVLISGFRLVERA